MNRVVRKLRGGLDKEKEIANELGIVPGTEVEIIGGEVYGSVSYYKLKGYEGKFNTVMFSGDWRDCEYLMKDCCGYRKMR